MFLKVEFPEIFAYFAISQISQISRSLQILWDMLCRYPKCTYTQNLRSISQSSTKIWAKIGFVYMLRSVGHLESNLDQKLISSSPLMGDSCCKTRLKYLDRFLRYFGKIFFKFSLFPWFCKYQWLNKIINCTIRKVSQFPSKWGFTSLFLKIFEFFPARMAGNNKYLYYIWVMVYFFQ